MRRWNASGLTDYGVLINSGEWGGKLCEQAILEMAAHAGQNVLAGRQSLIDCATGSVPTRFWGAPIPVFTATIAARCPFLFLVARVTARQPNFSGTENHHCRSAGVVNVDATPAPARRETDAMDTFVIRPGTLSLLRSAQSGPVRPVDRSAMDSRRSVSAAIRAVMHLIYTRFGQVMRDLVWLSSTTS